MKNLKDLTKTQKIEFLQSIQNNEIDVKKFNGKEPLFLTTKTDLWIFIGKDRERTGIAITPEAKEAIVLLKEAMGLDSNQQSKSIIQ